MFTSDNPGFGGGNCGESGIVMHITGIVCACMIFFVLKLSSLWSAFVCRRVWSFGARAWTIIFMANEVLNLDLTDIKLFKFRCIF